MTIEISNTTIRIAELAHFSSGVVDGLVATNVTFVGPAVVAILAGTMTWNNVTFAEPLDSILWDLDEQRISLTGAIGMRNFKLTECRFSQIGLAMKESDTQQLLPFMQIRPHQ